jgi:hypothetical protein
MNTRRNGAGVLTALLATAILAACGNAQDGGDDGGYAEGWQPGRYAPAPEQTAGDGVQDISVSRYQHRFE